jgi:hypothetical protein
MAALKKLQAREEEKSHPLSRADVDELIPNTIWIYEPGIHLGFLSETGKETLTIVFAVKIKCVFIHVPTDIHPLIINPVPGIIWNPGRKLRSRIPSRS